MAKKDTDLTYAEMDKEAGKLLKDMDDFKRELDAIDSRIDLLVENGYTTQKGSAAFEKSFKEFTKGAKKTLEGLQGMSEFLTKARKAYEDLDIELANANK
ncbi:WXG100 family type VII secretion target [Streptomyces sp. Je 1-332]|uniref:WXG100 family type VII secretion target n=1 Tax=Streptomyces sp. Je 1-332 TaxID=3231270 RepID=UPI003458697B